MKHFQDLELSVLVSLILEYLFDGDGFARLSDGRLEDNSEAAVANNLLRIISE